MVIFVQNNYRRAIKVNDNGIKLAKHTISQGQSSEVATEILPNIQKQAFIPHDMRLNFGRNRHRGPVKVWVPVLDSCQHNIEGAEVDTNQQANHCWSEIHIINRNQVPVFVWILGEKFVKNWSPVSLLWLVKVVCQVNRLQRSPTKSELEQIACVSNTWRENKLVV
ncbi:unnamed protein product [Pseudo-nitzschia multistriata]|uniref:Uncharacterized protein n=1 Tax=Pseudo-nitzschia multistriata TaxID=183589 RepID=A0A448ZCW2_9STRA|nr:unnamed protein product [Pseudo-nitzschia multistriata]